MLLFRAAFDVVRLVRAAKHPVQPALDAAADGQQDEGQHHGVSPKYLGQYANHAAWLEDSRRTDNGTQAEIIVSNAMGAPVSRQWKGYWQRAA